MTVQSQTSYEIPKTQRAVVFYKHSEAHKIEEAWPVNQPEDLKPGQVLVRLAFTGICQTDAHVWSNDWPAPSVLPLVGGHEGAGYVAAIGANTDTTLKIGDAVGLKWLADSCLACEECRKGYESSCSQSKNHGYTVDGTFQQWAVSYARHVTPIPAGLPLNDAAPQLCAGETVYVALKEIKGNPGDVVVIPGAGGGLGHLACQYATAMGYKVIAIDSGMEKKTLLASLGVADFVDFKEGSAIESIKKLTGGHGAHAAVVVAGNAAAYNDALSYLRPHGTLVAVGLPRDAHINAEVFNTVVKSLRIVGSYVGNRQDAVECLGLTAAGKVHTQHTIAKFEDIPAVFARMHNMTQVGRVVVDCT